MPTLIAEPDVERVEQAGPQDRWLVFRYSPVGLFSLKMSRATSTAGKTLLVPTPYAIKLAWVDVALRHRLIEQPEGLIRGLAKAAVSIGVPQHACVTGTIQTVRQETRDSERKELPFYRSSIAMREVVHYRGMLRIAFDLKTCGEDLTDLLVRAAPAINYFGKRGSFFQYRAFLRVGDLDSTFTEPADPSKRSAAPVWGHRSTLDDIGPKATFAALNSFSPTAIERGVHRMFVDTVVPLGVHNAGPGFVHYCAPGAIL